VVDGYVAAFRDLQFRAVLVAMHCRHAIFSPLLFGDDNEAMEVYQLFPIADSAGLVRLRQ
jgi:hypothetical protein